MVEVVGCTFDAVVHCVLAVHTVPSAGLADVVGVSHVARRSACVLAVASLEEFPTDAAGTDCGCSVAGSAEDRAIALRADIRA